jgi:formyl-CoA transferase
VNTLEETLRDPQVQALRLFTSSGSSRQISPAFTFSETRSSITRPPPQLGEHAAEVLSELGLSSAEIRALAERKIV